MSHHQTITLSILASCLSLSAAFAAPLAKRAEYAEKIYNEYAASADDKVSFDLSVASQGRLKDLLGKPFSAIINLPQRKLTASDDGFVTAGHAFENVQANSPELSVMNKTVADFEAIGYPVAEGSYRVLDVITTMGRDVSSHKAIEFCWKSQFHCVLLDPSIEFIDSIANNRIKLMAEGAGPTVTTVATTAPATQGITAPAAWPATMRSSRKPSITAATMSNTRIFSKSRW
jgi:hypothetical protein